MNQTVLHYIYDPLCGWCYGAAPLLEAARQLPGIAIELHAGGLWMGANRPAMGKALRDYVRPHDERIQALTAQPFGNRYFQELLLTPDRQLDSEPPIRAILAVVASGGDGLQMLTRIQQSHYRDGNWIGDLPRLQRWPPSRASRDRASSKAIKRSHWPTIWPRASSGCNGWALEGIPPWLLNKQVD